MKKVLIGAGVIVVVVVAIAAALFFWVARNPLAVFEWTQRRALADAGFEQRSVEGPEGTLVYFEAGSGDPLVFLHGLGDQAGAWAQVAPAFTDRHRVVVVDMAGHGESAPEGPPLPMGRVVDGTFALLDAIGADRPATLVGNSLGAWLAMLYAEKHPQAVGRVVAVNGGPLRQEPVEGLNPTPQDREEARRLMEALRDPSSETIPGWVLDDIVRRTNDGPIAWMIRDIEAMERYLMDGRLESFFVPVDLVWGVSDGLMPLGYAERMAAELPRVRLTRLERCGHSPPNECPERLADVLRQVLDAGPPEPVAAEEAGDPVAEAG